jgi:outer membrane protein TolC
MRNLQYSWLCVILTVYFLFTTYKLFAEVLSIDTYKDQVQKGHLGFAASEAQVKAATKDRVSLDQRTEPRLFASSAYSDDKSPALSPFSPGKTSAFNSTVGVSQMLDFGILIKGSVSTTAGNTSDMPALPGPAGAQSGSGDQEFYSSQLGVEMSMPLLKNWMGSELKMTKELFLHKENSVRLAEKFRQEVMLFEAEMVYLRLSVARELYAANAAILVRQKKLRNWVKGRESLNFLNKADLLQAEVAVKAREFELDAIAKEIQTAERHFNTLRGLHEDAVLDELDSFESVRARGFTKPERKGPRKDVQAMQAGIQQARTAVDIENESDKPELNAFVSIYTNSKEKEFGKGVSKGVSFEHSKIVVGVKLDMPLTGGIANERRTAAFESIKALSYNYERKIYDEEREWKNLEHLLADAEERLTMSLDLEKLQRERHHEEKSRHKLGRSTLMQVMMSEQDLAQATLGRIKAESVILQIYAQMKTFGGT